MVSIFKDCIDILLHPIHTHSNRAQERLRFQTMKKNRLFSVVSEEFKTKEMPDFVSLVLVAWIFFMIYSVYSLIYANIGEAVSYEKADHMIASMIGASSFQKKYFIISLLANVVFFPLSAWVYVKLWRLLISFCTKLFDKDISQESIDDVVNFSLVSHFFLVIPVLGQLVQFISSTFYIFIGLRYNLRLSPIQSLMIVVSPLILIGLLLLSMALYVLLIINLIEFPINVY